MFKIKKQSSISKARIGELKIKNKKIITPCFLPDATRGVVKMIENEKLLKVGINSLVINTYHLYLTPGPEIIEKGGGAHVFFDWPSVLVSDSGGFQVFSLIHKKENMGRISDDSVTFRSPIDGNKHELTPEKSIDIQLKLGTDIITCLDDCPPHDNSEVEMKKSIERTVAWAKRCKDEYEAMIKAKKILEIEKPMLMCVIQGGTDKKLRKYCAEKLKEIGFDGYGYGARPVDKDGKFLNEILKYTAGLIPEKNFRFGLGIGQPKDILRCALMGWDFFDCVIPTREGRHGKLFLSKSKNILNIKNKKPSCDYFSININNAKFAVDYSPINKNSKIPELKNLSKSYLHHLFKIREPIGQKLASLNNLEFYSNLLKEIRSSIKNDKI